MKTTLAFAITAILLSSVHAGERGIVGITVDAAPDFRIITRVVPDSPAAQAAVQVGDRIVAIDGHSTAELHSAQELVSRASGATGTQVELQLERKGATAPLRLRIRRVAAPDRNAPPKIKIVPDPSGLQASSATNGLTRRWSESRGGGIAHLVLVSRTFDALP